MLNRTILAVLLASLLAFTGCGDGGKDGGGDKDGNAAKDGAPANDDHEKVADDTVKVLEEAGDIVGNIEDEESFDKAMDKLSALKPKLRDLAARWKKLAEPSEETKKEVKAEIDKAMDELRKEARSGVDYLKQNLRDLPELLNELKGLAEELPPVE